MTHLPSLTTEGPNTREEAFAVEALKRLKPWIALGFDIAYDLLDIISLLKNQFILYSLYV